MARPVSIIVSAWNCEKTISRCLDSLLALEPKELLVCDLGSTDRTARMVVENFSHLSLVTLDGNASFARARNIGLDASTQPLVLFVDGDWIAGAASVDSLIHELDIHSDCAIAVPRFVDDLGTNHIGHNVRRFPTA